MVRRAISARRHQQKYTRAPSPPDFTTRHTLGDSRSVQPWLCRPLITKCARSRRLRSALPDYGFQSGRGLGLRSLLGTIWIALKGWATEEVWTSLHPALALAKALGRHDALAHILWGLTSN